MFLCVIRCSELLCTTLIFPLWIAAAISYHGISERYSRGQAVLLYTLHMDIYKYLECLTIFQFIYCYYCMFYLCLFVGGGGGGIEPQTPSPFPCPLELLLLLGKTLIYMCHSQPRWSFILKRLERGLYTLLILIIYSAHIH